MSKVTATCMESDGQRHVLEEGTYTARVYMDVPQFQRHDQSQVFVAWATGERATAGSGLHLAVLCRAPIRCVMLQFATVK